jgi:ribosomal protein S18 acetylase RimI-like enzyme
VSDYPTVVPVSERASAVATLVSAFTNDPVERWLWPDDQAYAAHFPEFVIALGGRAFETHTAWCLDEFAAVALWFAPGGEPDGDLIVSVITETVAADKHDDTFAVLEQMDSIHPKYPHWYLPWFGVDAGRQGHGLGGQLMTHCLAIVDASDLPAYLETPNPRNISFYERHGFEVTGEVRAGSCPPITFMLRPAHSLPVAASTPR